MSELKVIKAYLPTFDADYNDMLLVSHTKENYVPAKQIECYLKSEADKVIEELEDELRAANEQIENLINSASSIMLFQDKVNDNTCQELRHAKDAVKKLMEAPNGNN